MSTKSSPKTPPAKASPFSFLRNFSRKQKKVLNLSVVGGVGVGKSAFVVRYLTRRFIGDYSSSISNTYPHSASLDNMVVPLVVWDTLSIDSQDRVTMCELLDKVVFWSDVIIILYSVTDMGSYNTANLAHKYTQNCLHQKVDYSRYSVPVILVGNKNDLWHDREVVTDQACQEAEAAGYTNYFEITARESLDQVRVVFHEGIRRGLACGEHRRGPGRRIRRSFSTDHDLMETSPESEEGLSPKSTVNLPNHIICHIKRRLISPKTSEQKHSHEISSSTPYTSQTTDSDIFALPPLRTRSNTFSVAHGHNHGNSSISRPAQSVQRQRKFSVFEPRSAST
jgi:GTPase SAR1 family protein